MGRKEAITKPKELLIIIEQYIEKKIEQGVQDQIHELNEPDGPIIYECIVLALKKAKVPMSKWDGIIKYVEKSKHKEGFKFKLW